MHHEHEHEEGQCSCGCCGHDHHEEKHEHHDHESGHCSCCDHEEHAHEHEHEGCSCGCGHAHHHEHEHCACGHDHHHEHGDCGCGCGHDHGNMQADERKKVIIRIAVSAVLLIAAWLSPLTGVWRLLAFLVPYLIIGYETLLRALKGIRTGRVFDESFLMAVASIGAICIGEYPEAVAVMLFNAVGELFEDTAVRKSRGAIASLMDIRPDHANVERGGEVMSVSPEDVQEGEIIVVRPGERVPLDGEVIEGDTTLDTSSLTGESVPRSVHKGESIISGCVNLTGVIRVRTTGEYAQSTVSRILELVEKAAERKAKTESLITRFAKWYTPIVCLLALLVCILPPLFIGAAFTVWLKRALVFLVISCPCALVLSVPLTFYAGIGCASKNGILVKGSQMLEALCKCDTVVFDKTGTLTEGKFAVRRIDARMDQEELLKLAAHAESWSSHPIAQAICAAYAGEINHDIVSDVQEMAGHGVTALVDGRSVAVGNSRLMHLICGAGVDDTQEASVYMAIDGVYAGSITIEDQVKAGVADAVDALKALRVNRTVMLTGDKNETALKVAEEAHIDEVHAELLPQDKVTHVEKLLESKQGTLVFVGDGVNDAPVLARADVGVAMGALGSDAAVEAADVVLMDDDPARVPLAIRIARRTQGIAWQNIIFALGVKILVMALGTLGITGMWEAVFADVGVMVLAVLNATRAMKIE